MATTTNYGWTTPDDTALVKDGASAIRTLGSSVDTTVKNLNPETTLGDISYRSSTANTNTRLAIGTTGQILTVSGGVPSWATPASSGGMTLLSTTTLSGTTTTISSISSSYKSLVGYIYGINIATSDYPEIKPNGSALTAWTAIAQGGPTLDQGSTQWWLSTGSFQLISLNPNNAFTFAIDNYASSSSYKPISWNGYFTGTGTSQRAVIGAGAFRSDTAITSLQITSNGAVTYNGGTLLLYGMN